MALLPKNNADRVAFFNTRTGLWTTNATAIGTTTTAVTALSSLITTASSALAAQTTAQNAAKAATDAVKNAMDAMTNAGMAIIEQVRTKARSAGDSVYPLANIPAPATPSPTPAPGTPNNFSATLNADGSLTIEWKCASPGGGVTYQVYRRVTPTGDFAYQANTGLKKFDDSTIPAGSSQVTYQVRAVRSTAAGAWAQFNVNFGAGGIVTSSSEEKLPRIAA
jgi:hypothetical protein